jgi:hypothetical protein
MTAARVVPYLQAVAVRQTPAAPTARKGMDTLPRSPPDATLNSSACFSLSYLQQVYGGISPKG